MSPIQVKLIQSHLTIHHLASVRLVSSLEKLLSQSNYLRLIIGAGVDQGEVNPT